MRKYIKTTILLHVLCVAMCIAFLASFSTRASTITGQRGISPLPGRSAASFPRVNDGKVMDTHKSQMMNLAEGTVWRYMIEDYYPSLCQTSVFVVFKTKRRVNTLEELVPIHACAQPKNALGDLIRGEVRMTEPAVERRPMIAVKTNLLYDVLATPNVAVELPICKRWSIFADYTFPWWEWDNNSRAWEDLDWKLGARYWFGDRTKRDVLTGFFAGGF